MRGSTSWGRVRGRRRNRMSREPDAGSIPEPWDHDLS